MWISKEKFDRACANFDKQVARIEKQEQLITALLYHMDLKAWEGEGIFPRMVSVNEYESLMDEIDKQGKYKHRQW